MEKCAEKYDRRDVTGCPLADRSVPWAYPSRTNLLAIMLPVIELPGSKRVVPVDREMCGGYDRAATARPFPTRRQSHRPWIIGI